jgi:hypothetical protein
MEAEVAVVVLLLTIDPERSERCDDRASSPVSVGAAAAVGCGLGGWASKCRRPRMVGGAGSALALVSQASSSELMRAGPADGGTGWSSKVFQRSGGGSIIGVDKLTS